MSNATGSKGSDAERDRAETLVVNEACNQFLETLYTRLGDRVLLALADTRHVHSRAIVASREGDGGEVNLDAVVSGNVPETRVVLPVAITVGFGRCREVTAPELVAYMANAKANARNGKVPEPLADPLPDAVAALLRAWWGGPEEPTDTDTRDDDTLETALRSVAAAAGVSVPAWAALPPLTCVGCSQVFYSTSPSRTLHRLCPRCRVAR